MPKRSTQKAAAIFNNEKISKEKISNALSYLMYNGHMGEKIKPIENPDIEVGGKVYIITDDKGKEIWIGERSTYVLVVAVWENVNVV